MPMPQDLRAYLACSCTLIVLRGIAYPKCRILYAILYVKLKLFHVNSSELQFKINIHVKHKDYRARKFHINIRKIQDSYCAKVFNSNCCQ